jgi:hypothetical protein
MPDLHKSNQLVNPHVAVFRSEVHLKQLQAIRQESRRAICNYQKKSNRNHLKFIRWLARFRTPHARCARFRHHPRDHAAVAPINAYGRLCLRQCQFV